MTLGAVSDNDYQLYYRPTEETSELRECPQWQLSAFVVTLAWINLLIYMRQVNRKNYCKKLKANRKNLHMPDPCPWQVHHHLPRRALHLPKSGHHHPRLCRCFCSWLPRSSCPRGSFCHRPGLDAEGGDHDVWRDRLRRHLPLRRSGALQGSNLSPLRGVLPPRLHHHPQPPRWSHRRRYPIFP